MLFASACGSDESAGTAQNGSPGAPASPTTEAEPFVHDCVRLGFPCDLAGTPPELVARTQDLLTAAGRQLAAADLTAALEFLRGQPDVVEAFGSGRSIAFRVDGAATAWLVDHSNFKPQLGPGAALAPTRAPAPQLISIVGEDTTPDGQIDNRDAKRALVLAPYLWELTRVDDSDRLAEVLELMPGYAGNVVYHANRRAEDQEVLVEDWLSLDRYDAIFVATHGLRQCDEIASGARCETIVETGIDRTELDADVSDYSGFNMIGRFTEQSNTEFELGVGPYFFTRRFPNGLDNVLLSLTACSTGSITGDEFAAAAGRDNFVMTAWTEPVPDFAGFYARAVLVEQLSLGLTSELAYQAVIDAGYSSADNGEGITLFEHISPHNDEVRLFELPVLMDGREPMLDGNDLAGRVIGSPGDNLPDRLTLDLRVSGVDDPARFRVRYEVAGETLGDTHSLNGAIGTDVPFTIDVSHELDLGFDLPAGEFPIAAIVELPEGGESRYSVTVSLAEPGATITVGNQTWDFVLFDLLGGCSIGTNNVVVAGAVGGDLSGVTFSADLTAVGGELDVEDPATDRHWLAAADREGMTVLHLVPDGNSQIDSIDFTGNTITGTATFIETRAFNEAWSNNGTYPDPVEGRFRISCPSSVGAISTS
ncbi:MAG: hypothetical protein R3C39_10780 [Dehalococcoidia bacterium]